MKNQKEPDITERHKLLRYCFSNGYSIEQIEKMAMAFKDKTQEEKEAIAAHLLKELQEANKK